MDDVYIWRKLPADTRFDLSLDWLSFATYCNGDQRTKHAASVRPDADPAGKELQRLPEARTHGGATAEARWALPVPGGPTQNFCWVGHNAFGRTSNWPVYSLILFVNLPKLVPPDVRF